MFECKIKVDKGTEGGVHDEKLKKRAACMHMPVCTFQHLHAVLPPESGLGGAKGRKVPENTSPLLCIVHVRVCTRAHVGKRCCVCARACVTCV